MRGSGPTVLSVGNGSWWPSVLSVGNGSWWPSVLAVGGWDVFLAVDEKSWGQLCLQ